jgi:hypothetical protein
MKRTTKLLLFVLLSFYGQVFAQVTQTIDLRTGVYDNSNNQIPTSTHDDTWTVCIPGSNPNIQSSYVPTISNNNIGANLTIPGTDPNVRWISPLFPSSSTSQAVGVYHYKMTFYVRACNIQSAVFNFTQIGADNTLDNIEVNGNPHAVNFGFTSLTQSAYTNNTTLTINGSEIIPGLNTILIRVNNFGTVNNQTGLVINGGLNITSSNGFIDFDIKDKNGVSKTEFCLEEDVFLKETGSNFNAPIGLEISEMNGNTPVWTVPFGTLPGSLVVGNQIGTINNLYPFETNITKLFENNSPTPVVFQPSKTYRVRIKSSGSCSLALDKYFTYKCCASSIDASFWGKISNGQLSVSSPTIKGTHEWKVYSIANGITGQYTLLSSYTTPSFLFDLTGTSTCYYVTHSIKTPCGDACAAQIICKTDCDEKECNLASPTGLTVNHVNGRIDLLTWTPVPMAVSYTVEVTPNDPRCCGGGGNSISAPFVFSNISSAAYELNVGAGGIGGEVMVGCYSWRVIATCPDGGSVSSGFKCSGGDGIGSGGGNNEMGKRALTTGEDATVVGKSAVNVFPNPTKGMISFEISTTKEEVCNITITDLAGKKIESFENMKTSNKKLSINWNAAALSQGEYLVKIVTSDNQLFVKKFIKE